MEIEIVAGIEMVPFPLMTDEESAQVLGWRNDDRIRRWMCTDRIIPLAEHRRFVAGLADADDRRYWLARSGGRGQGVFSLTRIDRRHRNAYLGIYRKPDAGDADLPARTILAAGLELAFRRLGLHTVKLEVVADNDRALRFYERNRFAVEGRLKDFYFMDGAFRDVVVMGIGEADHA